MPKQDLACEQELIVSRAKQRIRVLRGVELSKLRDRLWKLIANPRYHYDIFCTLYFELCEQTLFENPRRGLIFAEFAPDFAGSAVDVTDLRKQELMVRGLAILGGGYRAVGHLDAADSIYDRASRLLTERSRQGPVAAAERSTFLRKLSCLRTWQGRHKEALALAGEAKKILYESILHESEHPDLCRALSRHGVALYYATCDNRIAFRRVRSQIIADMGEALVLSTNRDPRTQQCALHNLGAVALKSSAHADVKEGLLLIQAAKRRLRRPRGGYWQCLPRLKLQWVESKFFTRVGATRHSERLLRNVYPGMRAVGAFESVLAGLDLAELYFVDRCWKELETLAQEIRADLVEHSGNATELRAVAKWRRRVQRRDLTLALLEEVRQKLETRSPCAVNLRPTGGKVLV